MEAASIVVVKVKYGDITRRFNAQIIGEELDLTVDGLRERIRSLFNLSPNFELILTYIDEDDDLVHLVDADDLCDMVKQHLDPLRFTVQLGSQRNVNQSSRSTEISTLCGEQSLQNLHSVVTGILKTVPGPLCETLVNLSSGLTSKALSTSPHFAELVDTFSKVGLSNFAQLTDSQTEGQSSKDNEPENNLSQTENKDMNISEVTLPSTGIEELKQVQVLKSSEGLKGVQPERDVDNDKQKVKKLSSAQLDRMLPWTHRMKTGLSGHGSPSLYSSKREKIIKIKGYYPSGKSPSILSSSPIVGSQNLSVEKLGQSYNKYLNNGNNLPIEEANKLCSKSSKLWPRLDSQFIEDLNVFHGTVLEPSTPFTKKWRMRNSGTVEWPQGTRINLIGGDLLRNDPSVVLEIPMSGVPVDQDLDIAVDFVAPELPGQYLSYLSMVSPSGQEFGQLVWVDIKVGASVKTTPCLSISDVDLPSESRSCSLGSPDINLKPWLILGDIQPQSESKKTGLFVEPVVMMQPDECQETKLQIDNSSLVGNGASSSSFTSPSKLFPVISKNDHQSPHKTSSTKESALSVPDPIAPVVSSPSPASTAISSPQESALELPEKKDVEEKLQDEGMGFKESDLNKEILRTEEYNLEPPADDLWDAISDWDPIQEEWQEMVRGFHEVEASKKLLEKNNGGVMRALMDFIAEEEN